MNKTTCTNREYQEDPYFVKCCERANVKVTVRQASKFRASRGLAYKHRHDPEEENNS